MTRVLVTGANGFVGKHLCNMLLKAGYQVLAAVRNSFNDEFNTKIDQVLISSIDAQTSWHKALTGVDVVIHLAARVHIMYETSEDVLEAYRTVNSLGTANLATQAAASGVKRFIFISSIKVLGESNRNGEFSVISPAMPVDAYSLSKYEAEQSLMLCAQTTGMEFVIIRPPLVYGPGVKGNFERLMNMIQRGFPLPLGSVQNRRSLVYVENLCALIEVCIKNPTATNKVFLVSDGEDISTPELISKLSFLMRYPNRLWRFPVPLLRLASILLGKQAELSRLSESMQIDSSDTFRLLEWQPPFSLTEGLTETVREFLKERKD